MRSRIYDSIKRSFTRVRYGNFPYVIKRNRHGASRKEYFSRLMSKGKIASSTWGFNYREGIVLNNITHQASRIYRHSDAALTIRAMK
jgi:hypothetical protein